MALLDDFELLNHEQLLNINSFAWKGHMLYANLGDGYGKGVLSGNSSGLRKWALSSSVLPDLDNYTIDYNILGGADQTDTRFTYLFEFFKRHIVANNKPFVIRFRNDVWLVSFEGNQIDFEVITCTIFSGGAVVVSQRRVPELSFNANGSIVISPPIPVNLIVTPPAVKQMDISFDDVTGGDFENDYYELEYDYTGNPSGPQIIRIDDNFYLHLGLQPATEYCYRVRSIDVEGFVSDWSTQVCNTTI